MIKEFLSPDWRKLIVYLVFVIIFMTETLLIRSLFQEDYVIEFLSNVYSYFTEMRSYINFFTLAFFFYIAVLAVLYLLSCIVILITEKIKK